MNELNKYIYEIFGVEMVIKPTQSDQINKLPMYIANEYELSETNLLGIDVVLAKKISSDHFTPDQYKKQFDLLFKIFNRTIILVLPDIEAYKRNRLIMNKINFIIANKQVFIPELLLDIKEYKLKIEKKESLTPAAQCILLYHLQKGSLSNCTYEQIADKIEFSYLSVTRAIEILQKLGLCFVSNNRLKVITFEEDRNKLWQDAKAYFKTPLLRTIYYNKIVNEDKCCMSDFNALAHYTDINPGKQVQIAVSQDGLKNLLVPGEEEYPRDFDCKYSIQIWRYNPEILAVNGVVDPLSLYLSLTWNNDERVKMALEQLIKIQKW